MKLAALLLSLLVTPGAWAWDSPKQAVEKFLEFELRGGRMETWPIEKYLAVEPEYDEPGWDEFTLVQKIERLPMQCVKDRCTAPVRFHFVPTKNLKLNHIASHPNGGSEIVEYAAIQRNGEWLLESSGKGEPMVSYRAFKRAFRRLYPSGL